MLHGNGKLCRPLFMGLLTEHLSSPHKNVSIIHDRSKCPLASQNSKICKNMFPRALSHFRAWPGDDIGRADTLHFEAKLVSLRGLFPPTYLVNIRRTY